MLIKNFKVNHLNINSSIPSPTYENNFNIYSIEIYIYSNTNEKIYHIYVCYEIYINICKMFSHIKTYVKHVFIWKIYVNHIYIYVRKYIDKVYPLCFLVFMN